jgi:hypothetical protein
VIGINQETLRAPDSIEPIRGYRYWNVKKDFLESPFKTTNIWQAPDRTAACENELHSAPQTNCDCGIYAYYHLPSSKGLNSGQVYGVVAGWGTIEMHSEGFRTEYARILALSSPGFGQWIGLFLFSIIAGSSMIISQLNEPYLVTLSAWIFGSMLLLIGFFTLIQIGHVSDTRLNLQNICKQMHIPLLDLKSLKKIANGNKNDDKLFHSRENRSSNDIEILDDTSTESPSALQIEDTTTQTPLAPLWTENKEIDSNKQKTVGQNTVRDSEKEEIERQFLLIVEQNNSSEINDQISKVKDIQEAPKKLSDFERAQKIFSHKNRLFCTSCKKATKPDYYNACIICQADLK